MRVRVGIDGRILAHPKCGISTYVYNLVRNFLELNKDLEIFLFSDNEFSSEYKELFNTSCVHKVIFASSRKERKKWAQRFLPKKLRQYKIDIYHATWNNAVPFIRNCSCVLTIHDLSPWILKKEFKNKRKEIKYKFQHLVCAHSADMVITDSYKSKEDIVRLCKLKENKVKVVYLGLDEEFREDIDESEIQRVLEKYNLWSKEYLIDAVGIDHFRRNPLFVLEGFYELIKKKNCNLYLIYIGRFYIGKKVYDNLIQMIKKFNLEDRVIITGWIPTRDLKILLSQAKISIIPSLYEGFGLPVIESFACRVPVIATNRGAIPEIGKGAVILVDPFNPIDLSEKIEMLLEDRELRKSLIKKGEERLVNFAWENTARETLNIYKSLISK